MPGYHSRFTAALLLAGLLGAAAFGQWLETKVALPAAMLGPREPEAVVVTTDKVYVGGYGGSSLLVLDAGSMTRRAGLPGLVGYRPMAWAPQAGKLYAANSDRAEVAAIDCATDSTLAIIPVGRQPRRMLYDPGRNTVYCLGYEAGELAVIDVAADTVLAVIPVPRLSYGLALDPAQRKIYCTSPQGRSVTVIDADADTVLAVIVLSGTALEAVANPGRGKIYVGNGGSGALDIIDAAGDSLLGSIPGTAWPLALCYNPDDDKLYAAEGEYPYLIHVIDCATDSITASLPGDGDVWDAVYNPASNETYVTYALGPVIVICGSSDEIVAETGPARPRQAVVDTTRNRVYVTEPSVGRVSVIDSPTHEIVRVLATSPGYGPLLLDYDPLADRLYCADGSSEELFVLDGATNLITGSASLGSRALQVRACPALGKAYCGTEDGAVLVHAPGLPLRRLELGFPVDLLELNPVAGKLYAACRDDNRVAVINCVTDSVETVITLGAHDQVSALQAVPGRNELYIASGPAGLLTVVDGRNNRVVAYVGVEARPISLAYAPRVDRVYCGHDVYISPTYYPVTAVDAGRHVVVDTVLVALRPNLLAVDSTRNMLYATSGSSRSVSVVDCSSNTTVGALTWERTLRSLQVDPGLGRLYAADPTGGMVGVFDLETRRLLTEIPAGQGAQAMTWNPGFSRVYVACRHDYALAVIRDSLVVGVAEEPPVTMRPAPPTIIRGVLKLPGPGTRSELPERNSVMSRAALLDISGRKVMDLQPGENDVRHLAPGVYFVRASLWERSPDRDFVRKVVIQR